MTATINSRAAIQARIAERQRDFSKDYRPPEPLPLERWFKAA